MGLNSWSVPTFGKNVSQAVLFEMEVSAVADKVPGSSSALPDQSFYTEKDIYMPTRESRNHDCLAAPFTHASLPIMPPLSMKPLPGSRIYQCGDYIEENGSLVQPFFPSNPALFRGLNAGVCSITEK